MNLLPWLQAERRDDYPAAPGAWILFWVSVLGLFVELMLIRWIGTEFRIFAYLQNTVLVTCFMGLGMGSLASRRAVVLKTALAALLALVGLLSIPALRPFGRWISTLLSALAGQLMWQPMELHPIARVFSVALGLLGMGLLLLLIWCIFVPIGQILGRAIDSHPRTILAYSINIAGSLIGILLFTALSALHSPPVAWVAVAMLLLLLLFWREFLRRWQFYAYALAMIGISVVSAYEKDAVSVHWSQYQKLVLMLQDHPQRPDEFWIDVNGAPYQQMHRFDPAYRKAHPQLYPPQLLGLSQYDIPALLHPAPKAMLIVGSGVGNDVMGALLNGAERVTAVEIDSVIADLGRHRHPDRPYDSPRVELVIDDARAYFARAEDRFDVIVFGLLDSHTATMMVNARLDHFVYTKESIAQAASLLADGGVMVLSFYPERPYVLDRVAHVLRDVLGEEPLIIPVPPTNAGWGGVLFVCGDLDVVRQQLAQNQRLATVVAEWQRFVPDGVFTYRTRITTDDWPYFYLERPHVPPLFFLIGVVLFLLFLWSRRRVQGVALWGRWDRSAWHFFFLGVGFLLLETQNVSKAAVAFGNTWIVNAVIISAILIMILLANLTVALLPRLRPLPVFLCLIVACFALYFVDVARFMHLPFWPKAVLIAGSLSLPVFFSGIAFIRSFVVVPAKEVAFGANMFGALVGGVLQSITFLTGMRVLFLMVAAVYVVAFATRPRQGETKALG